MPSGSPPFSTTGLLEGIAENALDDDYYEVRPLHSTRSGGSRTILTAMGLALFALLVTIASVQNRSDRPADQVERNTLIANIQDRKDAIDKKTAQSDKLSKDVTRLQALSNRTDPDFEALRVTSSDLAASGPGIVITADNSTHGNLDGLVTDTDMQLLVNGLWYAGAEAISINGHRLSTLSAIRIAGEAITVNFKSLTAPYIISVLGDTDSLTDRLAENPGGQYWAARVKKAGLRFDVQGSTRITVPAAPAKRVNVLHATATKGDS